MATATSSEIITTSPADASGDDRPEPDPTAGFGRGGEVGEGASPPGSACPPEDEASRDFPYFEFYPYGYLY